MCSAQMYIHNAVVEVDMLGLVMRTDARRIRGFACPATTRVVTVTRLVSRNPSEATV